MSRQQRIEELTHRLSELEQQRSRFDDDAEEWASKRNSRNERFRHLRNEISQLRLERDELNEKVKTLKQQRTDLKTKLHEKIEEAKDLNQEIRALAKKKPSRSLPALQKEFDELEWKIQTTSQSLQEERELVERVKELEGQLNVYRKLAQLNQKILETRAEVKASETQSELCHKKLTEIAQNSQEIHQKMLEKIEDSKKLKTEADDLHKRFLQVKAEAKPIRDEISQVANQIRTLKGEIRREETEERKKSEGALREKLEKQAREKLERGEKLTWEEFQLLAGDRETAQD